MHATACSCLVCAESVYSPARTNVFVFAKSERVFTVPARTHVFPFCNFAQTHRLMHAAEFKIFVFRLCSPAWRAISSISQTNANDSTFLYTFWTFLYRMVSNLYKSDYLKHVYFALEKTSIFRLSSSFRPFSSACRVSEPILLSKLSQIMPI